MNLDFTSLLIGAIGGLAWLLRLEGKVLAVEKYIVNEPQKFEQRIAKVEHDLAAVRSNLNQIGQDVSFIRGVLTERAND